MAKNLGAKQRAGVVRRVVKKVNIAADQLDGVQAAFKKMFGPLTPAERRDLRAGAKMLERGIDRLLRLLIAPRKRTRSKRSPKKGT
jgi:hypothetical protein